MLQCVLSQRDADERQQQHLSHTAHQPLLRGLGRPEHLPGGSEGCGPTACGRSVRGGRPLGWNWTTQPATWRCSRHARPWLPPASGTHGWTSLCRRAGGAPLLTFMAVYARSVTCCRYRTAVSAMRTARHSGVVLSGTVLRYALMTTSSSRSQSSIRSASAAAWRCSLSLPLRLQGRCGAGPAHGYRITRPLKS